MKSIKIILSTYNPRVVKIKRGTQLKNQHNVPIDILKVYSLSSQSYIFGGYLSI